MVSSKDVAKIANVSQATVSRVLNNKNVSNSTKKRVLKAIKELGYQPNEIARSLVMKETKTIALVSGSLTNAFFVESANTIINTLREFGYQTMVFFEGEIKLEEIFNTIKRHRIDGILFSSIQLDAPVIKEIQQSGIPHVFYIRKPRSGGNFVVLNNTKAAEILTEHLLDLGHRRIAYISGELNVSTLAERKIGFENVFLQRDMKTSDDLTCFCQPDLKNIKTIVNKLVELPDPPTAFFCATDNIALHCLDVVLARGLRVPEDISIAGIDNSDIAAHHAIQLTSVSQQQSVISKTAAKLLVEVIKEKENMSKFQMNHQIVVEPKLEVRRSTGPCRIKLH